MHGLPKLQLVESNLWLRFAPMEGLDTDEMMKKQWNCLGLTHFKADVGSVSTFHDVLGASWKGSRGDLRVGYIFDQIGRLPELTQLELGAQFKQLATLKGQGYLSRLSGLKQLKVWIANYDVLHLDNEEAEWMILNWPSSNN
ncbi:hypothetical protein BGZ46_010036 [Entomortierella lignicola]|nr:hypothetical protein BGZ46_010036 [Entomortierella lignicola]